MQPFLSTDSPLPGFAEVRRLSNAVSGEAAPFSTIAAGIPRSFPFNNASIHLHAAAFGELVPGASMIGAAIPGVIVPEIERAAGPTPEWYRPGT